MLVHTFLFKSFILVIRGKERKVVSLLYFLAEIAAAREGAMGTVDAENASYD